MERNPVETERLLREAYPPIAESWRAHDVSRCLLYFGLTRMSAGGLDDADHASGTAERHWREIEKPLHIHRILLQRSWVDIFRGDFDAARERANEARELLDSWPRHSWLQYARLDDHLGSIWRADALADPQNAKTKLERAAELKVPAALAVDSVRHSIADADARMRWATYVSARILAGAFAVAWEWENTELVSELVEYHSARGTFSAEPDREAAEWTGTATVEVPLESVDEYALVASGESASGGGAALTRLGPLPPLQMDPDHRADHDSLSRAGVRAVRPRRHRRWRRMVDVAVTDPAPTLVLRFADVGIATYASLRVVGEPSRTVTWVVEEPALVEALDGLADALPDPRESETRRDAVDRAITRGPFATSESELAIARTLGAQLLPAPAWQLLVDCVSSPRAALFVSPSARLARVPWGLLAMPNDEGYRLMELVDVLMATPPNIVHSSRTPARWRDRRDGPPLLVLDPRVPGQRPDSPLGSVLGRPSEETALARHFADLMTRRRVLPGVVTSVELFRRADADRTWLADLLAHEPSRLLYVGHATAADGDVGHAYRAALHLADDRPLTASDLMSLKLPMPPRVALIACASGGDYQFDEATGLVAAMILGGAQLVTATLWSLPTAAGYRQFASNADDLDPMADAIIAVDQAHETADAGCAVNAWQREQMRRWRDGDLAASPLYWAALVTFAVDGAR